MRLYRRRHGGGSLAGAKDDEPPPALWQKRRYNEPRLRGRNSGAEHVFQQSSGFLNIHPVIKP